jgi:hypothetical protein
LELSLATKMIKSYRCIYKADDTQQGGNRPRIK